MINILRLAASGTKLPIKIFRKTKEEIQLALYTNHHLSIIVNLFQADYSTIHVYYKLI